MKPTKRTYCNRKYILLQPGKWTHIFAAKIWEQKKIPCAFTFKYAKVFKSNDSKHYVRFTGSCTKCKVKLSRHLWQKPKQNADVVFECKLKNFQSGLLHKKKCQLKGYLRQKVASQLFDNKQDASTWKSNKRFNDDSISSILYSTTVLRKAKQQELDSRLELEHCDPILNLNLTKYESLAGIIRNLGLNPFFCMYWIEEQKIFYKTMTNQKSNSFLIIDVTGSFAKKLKLINNEKSPYIYLYQCVLVTETTSNPISTNSNGIDKRCFNNYLFLFKILADCALSPQMIVIDFSKALLMAVVKASANCADTYLQILYNIIILERKKELPSYYVRLDVNHFIDTVARWDCLHGKVAKVRQLYI